MSQTVKQIKVVISCPSDVIKEKQIVEDVCEVLSKKNIHIRPIHWEKDVPSVISGDRPQKTFNKYFEEQDYDIYFGILWKRFGDSQVNGLTPTEEEFEDALKRCKETGRPLITVFFKKEKFYSDTVYEARQFLSVQTFKERIKSLGKYARFTTELEFQKETFVCIQDFVEKLVTAKDSQIFFERIKYPEVKNYITRSVCPANEYKPDDFWIIGDKLKKDITNIVKLKSRITLIGDAGCGKTFELKRIANHFSEENSPFYPQLIRLNTFTNQNIEQILPENWGKIPENQLLIILDGLDEIESKNKKDAIRKIEYFSEQHQAISIIISCRTNFYQTEGSQSSGTINGFEAYRLLDLDYDQIKSYAQLSLRSKASKFYDEIDRNSLGELLKVPFYLVKLVELFEVKTALPNQKASIFEQLLLARIKFDKEHFRTTIELDEYRSTIIKNLERIALCMETLCRNYISDDEFKILIPDMPLRNLIKHCTAWKKEEGESLTWQFEHNNIQEYLAAKALSRQSLGIIKNCVSFKPEHRKIIPSWVNAVSFLLSMSDDSSLFDWILEIEPEICLKFESDKIAKIQRIKIFKDIFNRYKEKQIWIDIDRFKNDELARFGQFEEIIEFLLTEAENAAHQTTLGNAIEILSAMLIPPDFKGRSVDLLIRAALNNLNIEINESIQSKALIALSDLKFDSKDVVERIVSKLRSSKSDWVRYGLYYFIHNSKFLDDFVDVFIDGISYASIDFSSGGTSRLSNERWELKQGLKKVQSFNSARKILDYFVENGRDLNDLFVGDHDISFIAEIAAKAFSENPLFLDHAVNFSLFMFKNYHSEEAGQFLLFYEKTGTRFDAFKKILGEKKSHYKEDFLADLADEECLDYFIKQLEKGKTTDDEMWAFLQTLRLSNLIINLC
jgi:GTPase SAR1 family protein